MIYNKGEYKVKFYRDEKGNNPIRDYLDNISEKERSKIVKYVEFLRVHKGYLDEPYSKHIVGKIRELRVDFARNRHRIFFFTFVNKNIILLHVFLKKTKRTPQKEINIAQARLTYIIDNSELYE